MGKRQAALPDIEERTTRLVETKPQLVAAVEAEIARIETLLAGWRQVLEDVKAAPAPDIPDPEGFVHRADARRIASCDHALVTIAHKELINDAVPRTTRYRVQWCVKGCGYVLHNGGWR